VAEPLLPDVPDKKVALLPDVPDLGETSISSAPEIKKRFRATRTGSTERPPTRREILEEDFGFKNLDRAQGGNAAARLAASLGDIDDVRRQLGTQFNVDPETIDLGNFEGVGIIFKNPQTGEFEPLNVPGLDTGDLATVGAEIPVIAAEVGGAVVGGVRAGPLGVAVGAGLGAGTARAAQLKILEEMGILTPQENEILKRAGTDAALATGLSAVPTAGRVVKGAFKPKLRAANELADQGVTSTQLREGREALAPLEESTGAKFSAGQRLSAVEEEGQVVGQRLRKTELERPEATADDLRQQTQLEAENKARQALTEGSADIQTIGGDISQQAKNDFIRRRDDIVSTISTAKNVAKAELDKIAGTSGATAGGTIRGVIQKGRDEVFETLSNGYKNILQDIPATTNVSVAGVRRVGKKWQARLNASNFPSLETAELKLVKDTLAAGGDDISTTMAATNRDISLLKSTIRDIGKPSGAVQIREKKLLTELVNELETARNAALDSLDPELARQVRTQDALWRTAKDQIDRGIVGDILAVKKGRSVFKVKDEKVFRTIIGSESELKSYLRLVEEQNFPELNAIDDLKNAFDGAYTDEVINGNTRHNTWMARNRKSLELLYSPEEIKRYDNAGALQDEIVRLGKEEDSLIRELKGGKDADGFVNKENGLRYRLAGYDPEEAVRVTKGSPEEARRMVNLLGEGDKLDSFRQTRVKILLEENKTAASLKTAMSEGKTRRELEVILGNDHVAKLDELVHLSEIRAARGLSTNLATGAASDSDTLFGFVKGLIFGPLNKKGYRVRLAQRFFPGASDKAMLKLLQDPDTLEQVLRINEMRVEQKAYWNFIVGTLGFTANDISQILENERLGPKQATSDLMKLIKESK
jgi:hypothetical protein